MKAILNVTMLVSTLVLAAPGVAGNPSHREHERQRDHSAVGADVSASMIHHLVRAVHTLELDEDQKEVIHAILQDNREDLKANHLAAAGGRQQLHEILSAETLDEEALASVARREGDLLAERIMIAGSVVSRVLAELDDSQRSELESMGEEHRQIHRHHVARRDKHESED